MRGTGPTADTRLAETHREWLLLGVVLAMAAVFLGLRFHPFLIPNNDFHTFADAARKLVAGTLPFESKRLPLFPALMALLAPWLPGAQGGPGEHPFLTAALLWNAAFSLGSVVLVFLLARRFVGQGAVLAPILYLATMQLFGSGLEPLVDASLGFFVLAAFVLFAARSPWQYAAAAAVALSRYEAAALVPVLVAANVVFEGRVLRPLVLGGLSLVPLLAWRVASSLSGISGGSYLDLMEGMGFTPAPDYLGIVFAEAFPILYAPLLLLPVALVLVGVPLLAGAGKVLRHDRRLTWTMLAFFAVQVGAVVTFGVAKGRYAQAVTWLPVVLWTVGALHLAPVLDGWLARASGGRLSRRSLRAVAGGAFFGAAALGIAFLQTRPILTPGWLEPVAAGVWLAAAVAAVGARRERPGFVVLLVAVALLVPTGLARQRTALFDLHYANHGSHLLGAWIRAALPPGGGVVVLNHGAVMHASGLPDDRLVTFGASRATTPEELAAFMRERGITHVAWTWRPPAETPSASYYHERMNVELAERFHSGEAVPGYRHVAELPMPAGLPEEPVQIYRLVSSPP